MKKQYFLAIALCLVCILQSLSQSTVMKWGKLSENELEITSTKLDTTANAIILGEYGHIKVNYGNITIETFVRLKILDKNGFGEANITLPFFFKNDAEQIIQVKAQTINQLPNGKIEKIEVNKNQIFTVDIDDKWKAKKFTFPAIKVGSILEYRYRKVSENYYYLDDWHFQKDLPVLYSGLEVIFPDVLEYNCYMFGHRLKSKYKGKKSNKFVLQNLPPIKDQEFIYTIDNYTEKIRFQLVSYLKKREGGMGTERVRVLEDWEKLADEVTEDYEFQSYEKARRHYEEIMETLEISSKPPIERLNIIYNFISKNFRWNEDNGIFNSQKLKNLVESRTGNTADINLYLVNLLKTAGISAYPMLISTRTHGNITKKSPLLSQFNRMIAYAELPHSNFVMSATNPENPYTFPGLNDYVNEGFVLRKNGSEWQKISPNHESRNFNLITVSFDPNGIPIYDVSAQLVGYNALRYRRGINKQGLQYIFNQLKNTNISRLDSIIVEQFHANSKPLRLKYKFKANESAQVNDEMIYFDPFIFNEFQSNPFIDERRFYPIELPFESNFNLIMNMIIPEGFEIIGMPKSERFVLPNSAGSFSYQTKFADDKIQFNIKIKFQKRVLSKNYNDYLKEFYDILIEKINEQVVMRKVAT